MKKNAYSLHSSSKHLRKIYFLSCISKHISLKLEYILYRKTLCAQFSKTETETYGQEVKYHFYHARIYDIFLLDMTQYIYNVYRNHQHIITALSEKHIMFTSAQRREMLWGQAPKKRRRNKRDAKTWQTKINKNSCLCSTQTFISDGKVLV